MNLAAAACDAGYRTLLFDGDMGLANVDVVLGLHSRHTIVDVLDGRVELKDIILNGPKGMKIIPSGSGVTKLTRLTQIERLQLLDQIEHLNEIFDIIIVDTGAGVSDSVLGFLGFADRVCLVTTSEPHAMTDAYALMKVAKEENLLDSVDLIVNMVRSKEEGEKIAERLNEVSKRFLGTEIRYQGAVLFDSIMQRAVKQRQAIKESGNHSVAGQQWSEIMRKILSDLGDVHGSKSMTDVWKNLLWKEDYASSFPRERIA